MRRWFFSKQAAPVNTANKPAVAKSMNPISPCAYPNFISIGMVKNDTKMRTATEVIQATMAAMMNLKNCENISPHLMPHTTGIPVDLSNFVVPITISVIS